MSITTKEVEVFTPKHTLSDFIESQPFLNQVIKRGYKSLKPIQDEIIPYISDGNDVVGLANTGTGKTAAFLIPLVNKILANRSQQVLILVPTRELALQINEELKSITHSLGIHSVVCVGGMSIGLQIRDLRRFNNFIIGTPGRTLDLMKRKVLKLETVKNVVLDEADRMLDMGFINDIRLVMKSVNPQRQTLCFSATMSAEINKIINEFLNDPITISVKTRDIACNIEQDIIRLQGRIKIDVLHDLLKNSEFRKVLVFGRTKHGVEDLFQKLEKRGIKAGSIHGNKSHNGRQRSLKNFKYGFINVLVATDVAARGLDIDNISHVINYELPENYDDYIHRIGRTGRGDKKGKALTFVN
ncbi:MAG: DEAD/DEAH box helicase [bacterium]